MTTYAIILFAIAAIGGLILATRVLTGRLAPWSISIIHALIGAAGLIVLLIAIINGENTSGITAAFALLLIAALGGFFLASYHLRNKIAPKAIVIIHAGVAVTGFAVLLISALS